MTAKRERPERLKFGWCNDGNHQSCRVSYTSTLGVRVGQEVRCECECHD